MPTTLHKFILVAVTFAVAAFGRIDCRASNTADSIATDSVVAAYPIQSAVPADTAMLHFAAGKINALHGRGALRNIGITGSSSPDGPLALNTRLARDRAEYVRMFILNNTRTDSNVISINIIPENFGKLARLTDLDADIPDRNTLARIIASDRSDQAKERLMKALNGGKTWRYLARNIFPQLRFAQISIHYTTETQTPATLTYTVPFDTVHADNSVQEPATQPDATPAAAPASDTNLRPAGGWQRHLYLKTNIPAWGMLWINLAAEIDLAPHWSAMLPVYYSGFNYFTGHRKFRTLTVLPEARYWFEGDNRGWFVGVHTGFAYYNVAFGGKWRYQDHNRQTPALGAGIAAGFRKELGKKRRWSIEASVGAGIYRLDYDVFENFHNGHIVDRVKRTFYGIDNAAISIGYRFDLGAPRKGGDTP